MNHDIARRNLADIGAVLDAHGRAWFLHAGTCLGAIREGDLIPHDYDTDLGLMPADLALGRIIPVDDLRAAGFSVTYEGGVPECGRVLHLVRDGERTDIFRFYDDGDVFWHACYYDGRMIRYEFSPFALAPCDALGFPAWVPDPTDRYLTENYGDWHTVVTEWDYRTDPKSIVRGP